LVDAPALQANIARADAVREALLANPTSASPRPEWVRHLIESAAQTIESGFSAILIVPDFRDQSQLRAEILQSTLSDHFIDYNSEQTSSKRYSSFLSCLTEGAHLVLGSRAAIFAPLQNLGLIAIFDDGDRNLQDQQSPYAHVREVALLRQSIDKCSLLFVSHARSTEVQRLVEMQYVSEATKPFAAPSLAFDESSTRVSSLAWQAIREASKTGAVLVQVAAKGTARTAYCQRCSTRALCSRCHGPLWIDSSGVPRCRWCNAQNLSYKCTACGTSELRQGLGGSTRTAAEFGKAFAGVQIIEASAENPLLNVSNTPKIVVATPGAEPNCDGGYGAVVIVDAQQALAKDSLRATEDAVRVWSNAIEQ
jgi:primosomal protein N' (replication factor Y)